MYFGLEEGWWYERILTEDWRCGKNVSMEVHCKYSSNNSGHEKLSLCSSIDCSKVSMEGTVMTWWRHLCSMFYEGRYVKRHSSWYGNVLLTPSVFAQFFVDINHRHCSECVEVN